MFNPSSFSAKIRIFSKSDYKKQKNVTNDLKLFLFFVIISLFFNVLLFKIRFPGPVRMLHEHRIVISAVSGDFLAEPAWSDEVLIFG